MHTNKYLICAIISKIFDSGKVWNGYSSSSVVAILKVDHDLIPNLSYTILATSFKLGRLTWHPVILNSALIWIQQITSRRTFYAQQRQMFSPYPTYCPSWCLSMPILASHTGHSLCPNKYFRHFCISCRNLSTSKIQWSNKVACLTSHSTHKISKKCYCKKVPNTDARLGSNSTYTICCTTLCTKNRVSGVWALSSKRLGRSVNKWTDLPTMFKKLFTSQHAGNKL